MRKSSRLGLLRIDTAINLLPMAELHIHVEGTLEDDMKQRLAKRNQKILRTRRILDVRGDFQYSCLQEFLDLYYEGCEVLIHERDFYEMTEAYFYKVSLRNVRHVELFFDPQSHTARGVAFETVVNGIYRATKDAFGKFGITSHMIMCFLRHLPVEDAMKTFEEALPFKDKIVAIGLDSSERDFPPRLFEKVFAFARKHGFKCVAHAGEEGPADYIWEALDLLQVSRIDHGVRCEEDPALVRHLADRRIPLTMCPLSSLRLSVVKSLSHYPLQRLLHQGVCTTINSDDPAYFGGYVKPTFQQVRRALGLTRHDVFQLARNSFEASFISPERKSQLIAEVDQLAEQAGM